jgi:hypothetical protein
MCYQTFNSYPGTLKYVLSFMQGFLFPDPSRTTKQKQEDQSFIAHTVEA